MVRRRMKVKMKRFVRFNVIYDEYRKVENIKAREVYKLNIFYIRGINGTNRKGSNNNNDAWLIRVAGGIGNGIGAFWSRGTVSTVIQ